MRIYIPKIAEGSISRLIERLCPRLSSLGAEFVQEKADAEVIFCQQWHLSPDFLDRPTVVLERKAGTALHVDTRPHLANPHLKRILKNCRFIDRTEYNRTSKCFHEPPVLPSHRLSDEEIAKIDIGFSLATHKQMDPFAEREPLPAARRDIDVFFAGTVDYEGNTAVTAHRNAAFAALDRLSSKFKIVQAAGRPMPAAEYKLTMARSRVVFSPWGYGETCFREYEGILLGCKVVKPWSTHLEDAAGIFPDSPELHWCLPDFSDLEAVLARALDDNRSDPSSRQTILNERANLPRFAYDVLQSASQDAKGVHLSAADSSS